MNCRVLDLPIVTDPRGSLVIAEGDRHVPFNIRRTYWIVGVPEGVSRGAHAHRRLEQCFVAINGRFNLRVSDGHDTVTIRLSDPRQGLYLGPMMWRDITDFSVDACCLVLASEPYDEADYIRDHGEFLRLASGS